ncbi:MAG: hypothetical protein WA125_07655 [Desulfosporosinus sp.]
MNKVKPTSEEWSSLYQAAVDFKRSACWEWMYDNDIFGVVDPETGETAYCCIMGNNGEHFAVAGYLGTEGLNGILGLLSGEIDTESPEIMFIQKCLMCSFEDRAFLKAEDLKTIKALELKYRGRNQWPLFRHHEPGFVPWFIDAAQCRFLTHILRQALEVALRCRYNKEILDHETLITFLTRVCQKTEDGKLEWVDQYITVELDEPEFVSFYVQDEILLKNLKAFKPKRNLVLEADTYYAPTSVRENDRPYYPKVCVILNQHDGLVVSFELIKDIQVEGYKCVDMLVNLIERNRLMPAKLLVARKETYYLYSDVCKQLGLPIEMVEHLEYADEFRNGMFNLFEDTDGSWR